MEGRKVKKMVTPDFCREERLFKKGYKNIAGIDEAGRGPLAGPVVAVAIIFSKNKLLNKLLEVGIRDSKLLSSKKREYLAELIMEKCYTWSIGIVSEKTIDEINILEASLLAMKRAVEKLEIEPDFLLIDGNQTIKNYPVSQIAIPKADQYVFSVSAASILAKATRDKILIDLDEKYPEYGFAQHKGYGTKFHLETLRRIGPCKIHRKSFNPIKQLLFKFNLAR